MNKIIPIFLLFFSFSTSAQTPQSFKYQAVVRDGNGALLYNQLVSIKSSILSDSPNGIVVYSETHNVSCNEYGVVSINIGEGTVISGDFNLINWSASSFFLKTELDINGQENFLFMGTSQIMSVPYALFAKKAKSSENDLDTSAVNEIQNLTVLGNTLSISDGNSVVLPPDADDNPTNELQNLQLVGDSLKISNGNSIFLAGSIDLDASPTNELQLLSKNGDTLFLSNGNFVLFNDDFDKDSANELQSLSNTNGTISISNGNTIILADSSATNELQSLGLSGNTLTISNGNSVIFPTDGDTNPTNELQTISLSGNTLSISNGNSINLPTDNDSNPTNEIQNLSLNQGTLSISASNNVHLPDSSSTNEIQTLQIIGDSLHISNGNAVKITTNEHYLGEYFGGGIIFHLYKDSLGLQHGLIMTKGIYGPANWSTTNQNNLANSYWDGNNNTNLIMQPSIALTCKNLSITDYSGTYDDWYLPAINELLLLVEFSKKYEYLINSNSYLEIQLWSSTEDSQYNVHFASEYFGTNYSNGVTSKFNSTPTLFYRPIRKF